MTRSAAALRVQFARHLTVISHRDRKPRSEERSLFRYNNLAGRLTELSGQGDSATLTLAFSLVLDAQLEGETTAWITRTRSTFYPPDAARIGIDLEALAVICCPDDRAMARAADKLARSGAFGLLVLDLGENANIPMPLLSRLCGLAKKHDTAILFLTDKRRDAPSLGSLVSVRGEATRQTRDGQFACRFQAIKDKQVGPGWEHEVECHGPPGLC